MLISSGRALGCQLQVGGVLVYDQLAEIPSGQRAVAIGNRYEQLELCAATAVRYQPFDDSIPLRAAEILTATALRATE
ncbi:MAG: hypothetical protein OEM25_04390, partial [Gammaproteobacteria bacterium]|nr:hypothetical protein [Gammaproteobacteria bacterium]